MVREKAQWEFSSNWILTLTKLKPFCYKWCLKTIFCLPFFVLVLSKIHFDRSNPILLCKDSHFGDLYATARQSFPLAPHSRVLCSWLYLQHALPECTIVCVSFHPAQGPGMTFMRISHCILRSAVKEGENKWIYCYISLFKYWKLSI